MKEGRGGGKEREGGSGVKERKGEEREGRSGVRNERTQNMINAHFVFCCKHLRAHEACLPSVL